MEQYVTIKSYQHGFALYLKEDAEFDQILNEIKTKFSGSRQFFGSAKVSISLEGMELTEEQEMDIITLIQNASDLQIIGLVGKNQKLQAVFEEVYEQYGSNDVTSQDDANGLVWRGTVRRGNDLDSAHTIVVLGDVNPGAKVTSDQDIIVLGSLLGEAYAGLDGQEGHFIAALEMNPEKLMIGEEKLKKKPSKLFWSDSNKKVPKMAVVEEHEICLHAITKELLGKLTSL